MGEQTPVVRAYDVGKASGVVECPCCNMEWVVGRDAKPRDIECGYCDIEFLVEADENA